MMMAVIRGANSRSIDKPTKSATKMLAPYWRNWSAPWYATTMPSRNDKVPTMGSASKPPLRRLNMIGRQRIRNGWASQPASATALSPMKPSKAWVCANAAFVRVPTLANMVVLLLVATGSPFQGHEVRKHRSAIALRSTAF